MVNYATSDGFTFNMLMLKSFSICDECSKIGTWEESLCDKKLDNLKNYKNNLEQFEFEDEYEIKQQKEMVKNLSDMISKLESLKNEN